MPADSDRRGLGGDPPGEVRVTVVPGPRDTAVRSRIATLMAVLAVAIGVFVGTNSLSQRVSVVRPSLPAVHLASPYPVTCVSVAIALHDPRFARASFDRTLPCARGLAAGGGRPRAWRAVRGRQWTSA
ncbi:MAG TPA: hypothetical protein VMB27_05245 [Solirubrobacteraceae bacterium]|nr:hypothetical protein [Solirubrobacteraceae bacterium]